MVARKGLKNSKEHRIFSKEHRIFSKEHRIFSKEHRIFSKEHRILFLICFKYLKKHKRSIDNMFFK
jgi:hypothetical protein